MSTFTSILRLPAAVVVSTAMLLTGPAAHAGWLTRLAVASAVGYAVHSHAKHSNRSAANPVEPVSKGESSCSNQLPLGKAPTLTNPKLATDLQTICYREYTVAVSDKTRTPLWSAEFLTRQRIQAAKGIKRVNAFHEESAQGSADRAHLNDYVHVDSVDRGHMAPSRDMSDSDAQYESFSLANISPQNSNNNRHLWEGIESGTRQFALTNGKVYVITGPLFIGQKISFMKNRIAIPTQMFKLLYDPVRKTGGVYVVDNVDTQKISWKSIADFEKYAGYNFNIGNPPLMSMPEPRQHF